MNKTLTMYRGPFLLCLLGVCLSLSLSAQDYRTVDGSNNNLANPNWGTANAPIQRVLSNGYEDGISSPAGTARPNPRFISNTLFEQNASINDAMALSDFIWVFGQFIDHDLVAIGNDVTEPVNIPIDFDDPDFNPGGAIPGIEIKMFRSHAAAGTGTGPNNPRNHTNEITSWIDGSAVYGSDNSRANWLRSFSDGKLKTSAGNLLPYNTTTGEYTDPVDVQAPPMADDVGFASRLFVAGDVRANEQPLLTAMHTLFVREHNRICDELIAANPTWNDEEIYQHARKIIGGLIQAVVYEEWLPAMGVHLPAYGGYDDTQNGTIMNVFSAAAFRLGHTLLSSQLLRLDNNGEELPEGNLTLLHSFFNPGVIPDVGGIDPFFKGMGTQIQQELDCKMIEDVRSFLFGPPGAGGLDLAAININRGRERGLPDFNTIREDLGLTPYTTFLELNPDVDIAAEMENAYLDLNDIDPWVGMLAEYHMPNALFGETVMEIMERQFSGLREGDRFYYENDPILTTDEKAEIKSTTLRMIIMRNTDIELMQENVFLAMPHDSICNPLALQATISGGVATEASAPIGNVDIEIKDIYNNVSSLTTGPNGLYDFPDLASCSYYRITPRKDGNDRNGVSVVDLVLISRHLIGIQPFTSPYQFIAADTDNNKDLNTFDIINLQRLLLYIDDELEQNTSWRFVDLDYDFLDPQNPLVEDFPVYRLTEMLREDELFNFMGIKIGDLNDSADPAFSNEGANDREFSENIYFQTEEQVFEAGEQVSVALSPEDLTNILAFQFTVEYDANILEFVQLEGLADNAFALAGKKGALTMLWNSYAEKAPEVISLQFVANAPGRLSDVFSLNSSQLAAEAYDEQLEATGLLLEFTGTEEAPQVFQLYQNQPNPFVGATNVRFYLPATGDAKLTVFGLNGQKIMEQEEIFEKGNHEVRLSSDLFSAPGVYYYQLDTAFGSETGKMIRIAK